jgi:hypothetical protein
MNKKEKKAYKRWQHCFNLRAAQTSLRPMLSNGTAQIDLILHSKSKRQ